MAPTHPPPDPGEVFDQLLARSLMIQNSQPSPTKPSSLQKLRLFDPHQILLRHLPGMRRSLAVIEPALREAIRALVSAQAPWPLFLYGRTGTGKTCAALCLLDHSGGEYWTAARLTDDLNSALFGRLVCRGESGSSNVWPEQIWDRIKRTPLMVLDELGQRDKVSGAHYDVVKRVLDERQDRPLLVLSNLDIKGIDTLYDERVSSRLGAGTIVQLRGRDRRVEP